MAAISLHWKLIGTICAFFVLALIMAMIDESLFEFSLKVIKEFSKDWKKTNFYAFMRSYTSVGAIFILVVGYMYSLIFGPKIKQLMFLNTVLLSQAANAFLKNAYHQYRPCWAERTIPVYGKEKDFGNPSGHSTGCGAVVFSILAIYLWDNFDFCLNKTEELAVKRSRASSLYSPVAKTIITLVLVFMFLGIVFSRVYLGAHSFNQVLYGSLLGFFCPFLIFNVFRQNLIDYYKHLFLYKPINYRKNLILILALGILALFAHIATYVILKLSGVKLDTETLDHIRDYIPEFNADLPLDSGFINFGLGEMIMGAHIGVLFNLYYFDINPIAITLEVSFFKVIQRVLVICTIAGPIPVLAAIFLPVSPPLLIIWVKTVIPGISIGFILFGVTDYLLRKLKLLPEVKEESERDQPKLMEVIQLI